MRRLLSNCGIIETVNDEFHYIENGYLGINDDVIDYIGKEKPTASYDEEVDMENTIVMPGLINTHTHAAMTLLRGVGSGLPLQEWLFDNMFPIEDKMTKAEFKSGTELALMEMLSTGTTSFSDMYMEPTVEAELIKNCGIKANICRVMQGFNPEETYEDNGRGKESCELFENYNDTCNGRLKVDFCIHAEYTCQPQLVEAYAKDAKRLGARMHIHMSETKREHEECIAKYGKTPAQWFNDLGCFDVPTHAAHCVWVSDEDMQIMKEKGVSVAHNPTSNMKLGSGFAPIHKMMEMGINCTLGTDGTASNNNLNMFEEMHIASIIHNGYTNDPTIMKASDILKMATINGAKLQGRDDTGSLEVGKKADIIAIDVNKPHLYPNLDPLALLVYSAQGSDVVMTMVDGKILYDHGTYTTLDPKQIKKDVAESLDRLYK